MEKSYKRAKDRGLATMPGYWLYCLDGEGKITRSEWIEAKGDEEAIMIARAAKKSVACELWDHRFVVRIPAHIPN